MLAAESFLTALKESGVDFLFLNPGTDFAPIVEAFARRGDEPDSFPRPVLATHETIAAAMAHGAYLASGKPAAVMLHVNVGTANAICNLINAQKDHIPTLLFAGRTPFLEAGMHGSRSSNIHWGQEMFDQAGMVRDIVKWDYEWKLPVQGQVLVRRAVEVAMAHPRGPVYMTLPREVLAAESEHRSIPPLSPVAEPRVEDGLIEKVASSLARATSPLIITSAAGRDPSAAEAMGRLASAGRIPVVEFFGRHLNLSQTHEWHGGFDPAPYLRQADLVLVVESEVPWIPETAVPRDDAAIIHLASDPLFQGYPVRSFRSDLNVAGHVASALDRIADRLRDQNCRADVQPPRRGVTETSGESDQRGGITQEFACRSVQALIDDETVVFNEYTLRRPYCAFTRPGSYFGHAPAGGLGWGFGAALGYKAASPEKFVIATLGDGAYIFANPIAGHMVASAENLPILTIVFNNGHYGAVRRATLGMYGQGAAAADNGMLLARLPEEPNFSQIAAAHGAHAETVENASDLPDALARAKAAVLGGTQALVDVKIAGEVR